LVWFGLFQLGLDWFGLIQFSLARNQFASLKIDIHFHLPRFSSKVTSCSDRRRHLRTVWEYVLVNYSQLSLSITSPSPCHPSRTHLPSLCSDGHPFRWLWGWHPRPQPANGRPTEAHLVGESLAMPLDYIDNAKPIDFPSTRVGFVIIIRMLGIAAKPRLSALVNYF